MKQLIQNFKTGELYVDELPVPAITRGYVLVANSYSHSKTEFFLLVNLS